MRGTCEKAAAHRPACRIAEGDLVVLHVFSRAAPDDKGEAVVDIFRFNDDGKIVEHWDVVQPLPKPEEMAQQNGVF